MTHNPKPKPFDPQKDMLSTSLTCLNLATHGYPNAGLKKGHIYRFLGRPGTSKTIIGLSILCEAAINPVFNGYKLIYDNVERGPVKRLVEKLFPPLEKRLLPPAQLKDGTPVHSRTTDDFYGRLKARLDKGQKVIWVEDSLDALEAKAALTKMGDNKAKEHSQYMRQLLGPLEATDSVLIFMSQARANLQNPWAGDIAAGGLAPHHYSTLEIWMAITKILKRKYGTGDDAKELQVGVQIRATVKKNRLEPSPLNTVQFPISYNYGIDDIGSMIDWLMQWHWPKPEKGIFVAQELNFEGRKDDLIKKVEEEDLRRELIVLTTKVWKGVEDAVQVKREPRYYKP